MHGDPSQWFFTPVKNAIKSALVSYDPSVLAAVPAYTFSSDSISFNAIKRDGQVGATILASRQIVPSVDRKDELPAGGRTGVTWVGSDSVFYERYQRAALHVYFDVELWTPSAAHSTAALFHLISNLPSSISDGMLKRNLVDQDGFAGNPILLTPLSPMFPDDQTNVAKQHSSHLIVRADGHIYVDRIAQVKAAGRIRLANPTFPNP